MPLQVIIGPSLDAVDFVDNLIPTPEANQVVIKVAVSGSNPKDWKYPFWKNWPHNSGDDIAGVVHAVGKNVYEFKPGDRVAAAHQATTENGSFAEYAVAPDWTTFHLAKNVSFEEAATVPSAALTAAMALYVDLKLPAPYNAGGPSEMEEKKPLVIYGVASAVGAFAAKFARLSGLHPVIGIAGRAGDYASTLVDYVVDYRKGEDAIVASIEEILAKEGLGTKAPYVFDAVSEGGTLETTLRFLELNGGTVATVLPPVLFAKEKERFKYPAGVTAINTAMPRVHATHKDFGYLWSRYMGRLLQDGRLQAHPYEVVPGGLNGILTGLQKLRDGKASGVKYVYRIDETREVNGPLQENYKQIPLESAQSTSTHPLRNFPFPA